MRVRIEIRPNAGDPSQDLEIASSLRRDLWAHSPIEIDIDDPTLGTRRTSNGTAFFEFETEFSDEVERVVREYGYSDYVNVMFLPAGAQPSPS